jgi:hypothetical protein
MSLIHEIQRSFPGHRLRPATQSTENCSNVMSVEMPEVLEPEPSKRKAKKA